MLIRTKGLKISELNELNTITGDEMIPCQYGNKNGKIKVSKLQTIAPVPPVLDEYATKEELNGSIQLLDELKLDKGNYALKEEIPSIDSLATKLELENYLYKLTPGSNIEIDLHNVITATFSPSEVAISLATDTTLGGIKASSKTENETVEVKIDNTTGKLFVANGLTKEQSEKLNNIEDNANHTVIEQTVSSSTTKVPASNAVKLYIDKIANSEDITLSNSSITSELKLILADKLYDTAAFSGMGRAYLRKNITGGKNVLTQAMIPIIKPNTRFVVQYDYDLNGQTINIPEKSVLDFQGGSFKNGTLAGNDTEIVSKNKKIFENVSFSGSFDVDFVLPDWFGIVYDNESYDNIPSIASALDMAMYCHSKTVKFNQGNIWIQPAYIDEDDGSESDFYKNMCRGKLTLFNGCNILMDKGTFLRVIPNKERMYNVFFALESENITIKGGNIIGDSQTHLSSTLQNKGEWGYGIAFQGVKNSTIEDVKCMYMWGDGINIQVSDFENQAATGKECKNITIIRAICNGNRRNGLSIEGLVGGIIRDSEFSYNGYPVGTNPKNGIDIEPGIFSRKASDIYLDNLIFKNNISYDLSLWGTMNEEVSDVNIYNVKITNCKIIRNPIYEGANSNRVALISKDTIVANNVMDGLTFVYAENTKLVGNRLSSIYCESSQNKSGIKSLYVINNEIDNTKQVYSRPTVFNSSVAVEEVLFINNTIESYYEDGTPYNEIISFEDPVKDYVKNVSFISNTFISNSENSSPKFNGAVQFGNLFRGYKIYAPTNENSTHFSTNNIGLKNRGVEFIFKYSNPTVVEFHMNGAWNDTQRDETICSSFRVAVGFNKIRMLDSPVDPESLEYKIIKLTPLGNYMASLTIVPNGKAGNNSEYLPVSALIKGACLTDVEMKDVDIDSSIDTALPSIAVGTLKFITGKPAWWNGAKWVDSSGNAV